MLVSVTELMDFLRCRRAWGFQSANADSLVRKGMPNTAFHIGHTVHHGIEAQALGNTDPIAETERWLESERERIVLEYQSVVGAPMSSEETASLKHSRELGIALLKGYFDKWGWDNPIAPYRYIHPEVAFRIPIPGTDGFLVGTIDGIAQDDYGRGVIVEHKTYADTPAETKYLRADFQLHGYWWAFTQLFGEEPRTILWDGINKKLPKVPALLKDGKALSRAWIATTPSIYRQAIAGYGFDEADYAEILHKLDVKNQGDETMFHNRREIPLVRESVRQWGESLPIIYNDMKAAQQDQSKRYPNRVWQGCWDCWVMELCDAKQFGQDLDYLISNQYKVGTYGTQANQRLYAPTDVGSLEDLSAMHRKEGSA